LDKPPSFEELLEHAGVVFCNDPVVIIKSEHQQNLPISSWEELIEKLISWVFRSLGFLGLENFLLHRKLFSWNTIFRGDFNWLI